MHVVAVPASCGLADWLEVEPTMLTVVYYYWHLRHLLHLFPYAAVTLILSSFRLVLCVCPLTCIQCTCGMVDCRLELVSRAPVAESALVCAAVAKWARRLTRTLKTRTGSRPSCCSLLVDSGSASCKLNYCVVQAFSGQLSLVQVDGK